MALLYLWNNLSKKISQLFLIIKESPISSGSPLNLTNPIPQVPGIGFTVMGGICSTLLSPNKPQPPHTHLLAVLFSAIHDIIEKNVMSLSSLMIKLRGGWIEPYWRLSKKTVLRSSEGGTAEAFSNERRQSRRIHISLRGGEGGCRMLSKSFCLIARLEHSEHPGENPVKCHFIIRMQTFLRFQIGFELIVLVQSIID